MRFFKNEEMTKAELCKRISDKTGCDAQTVLAVVESLMVEVKESLEKGENVYLRGFGSFIVKQRAEKMAGSQHPGIQTCQGVCEVGEQTGGLIVLEKGRCLPLINTCETII